MVTRVAVHAQLFYCLITHCLLLTLLASHSHLKAANSCIFVVSLKSSCFLYIISGNGGYFHLKYDNPCTPIVLRCTVATSCIILIWLRFCRETSGAFICP